MDQNPPTPEYNLRCFALLQTPTLRPQIPSPLIKRFIYTRDRKIKLKEKKSPKDAKKTKKSPSPKKTNLGGKEELDNNRSILHWHRILAVILRHSLHSILHSINHHRTIRYLNRKLKKKFPFSYLI